MRTRTFALAGLCLAAGLVAPFAATAQAADTIGVGDLVRISSWREPAIAGEYQVEVSGEVLLPVLGSVPAIGRSAVAFRDSLLAGYRDHYTPGSLVIGVYQRVNAIGYVKEAGVYHMPLNSTLEDVVVSAGGAATGGNLGAVRLIREGEVKRFSVRSGEGANVTVRSGDMVYVDQHPWAQRNLTFLASFLLSATTVVASLLR